MLVTLWAIWHARRKAIHEEVFQNPLATSRFVDTFVQELGISQKEQKKATGVGGLRRPHEPAWIPPPRGSCKVNVDGAVAKTSNRGAVSAVCRSEQGHFMGASVTVFEGVTHPGSLEALACREAIALLAEVHAGSSLITSDCLEVIEGLHGRNLGIFSHILGEIKAAAEARGGISFRHESRRSNAEAHSDRPIYYIPISSISN